MSDPVREDRVSNLYASIHRCVCRLARRLVIRPGAPCSRSHYGASRHRRVDEEARKDMVKHRIIDSILSRLPTQLRFRLYLHVYKKHD